MATAKVVVTVDVGSAATGDADRDQAMPTADWFAAQKFPKAVFTTSAIKDLGGGKYLVQFAGANHCVHLRNVLLDLMPVALHQAAGDDELLGPAALFEARHLQNRVDRLLLGAVDERAGVHHDDIGVLRPARNLRAGGGEHPHHYLAVNQVLRAAEAYEAHA